MIEKLDTKMEYVEISVLGNKKAECLDFEAGRKLNLKTNELVDAVNELREQVDDHEQAFDDCARDITKTETMLKNINTIVGSLITDSNTHKKQIGELQREVNKMAQNLNFAQPEVKENAAENTTFSKMENVADETLKCPFCQQELKELYVNGFSVGFRCKNKNCPETNIMCGTKELWQELIRTRKDLSDKIGKLETELERTRKALDVALNCLNGVVKDLPWVKRTLEQITALEQKDK